MLNENRKALFWIACAAVWVLFACDIPLVTDRSAEIGEQAGQGVVSLDQAVDILLEEVVQPDSLDHFLIAYTLGAPLPVGSEVSPYAPSPLPEGVTSLPHLQPQELESSMWFFWIDDDPLARFTHPTRYVFIDVESGDLSVEEQGWWPMVDGESVPEWTTMEGRWNEANWAFSNLPQDEIPDQYMSPPSSAGLEPTELEGAPAISPPDESRLPLGGEAIVALNGYKPPDQVVIGSDYDIKNITEFAGNMSIPIYRPKGETSGDIEAAILQAVDAGHNDIFIYYTGHGDRIAGRGYQSAILYKDTKISGNQFAEMLANFSGVHFKVAIDACYSGAFIAPLRELSSVDIVLTSASDREPAKGDVDTDNDPNPDDRGGEYSSGLFEDLEEIRNSPERQAEARDFAIAEGLPDFVGWLMLAEQSAREKDAAAALNVTHPQVYVRSLPPNTARASDALNDPIDCATGTPTDSPQAPVVDLGDVSMLVETEGTSATITFDLAFPRTDQLDQTLIQENPTFVGEVGLHDPEGEFLDEVDPDWYFTEIEENRGVAFWWSPEDQRLTSYGAFVDQGQWILSEATFPIEVQNGNHLMIEMEGEITEAGVLFNWPAEGGDFEFVLGDGSAWYGTATDFETCDEVGTHGTTRPSIPFPCGLECLTYGMEE